MLITLLVACIIIAIIFVIIGAVIKYGGIQEPVKGIIMLIATVFALIILLAVVTGQSSLDSLLR